MNHDNETRITHPHEVDYFIRKAHTLRAEYTAELLRSAGRAVARGVRGAVDGLRIGQPRSRTA
jgi:hypothetical protein